MRIREKAKVWNRVFLSVEIAFVFLIAWWTPYSHLPAPGWAVAFIAGAAAAMSVHDEMKGWQKGLWLLIIGAFLVIETRAISKDRWDSQVQASEDRKKQEAGFEIIRSAQDTDFKATADGLKNAYLLSQQQFAATMQKSETIFGETKSVNALSMKNLIAITGGQDRPYFDLSYDGNMPGRYYLSLTNMSDHPYRGLQAMVTDVNKALNLYDSRTPHQFFIEDQQATMQIIKIGDVGISQGFTMQHQLPEQRGDDLVYLKFSFSSLTGFWGEDILVRRDKSGKPYRAIRRLDEKGITETIDPGFPRDSKGGIGW